MRKRRARKTSLAVFARMFEENNLTLTLSLPYESDHFRLSMENRYTDWDVADGATDHLPGQIRWQPGK